MWSQLTFYQFYFIHLLINPILVIQFSHQTIKERWNLYHTNAFQDPTYILVHIVNESRMFHFIPQMFLKLMYKEDEEKEKKHKMNIVHPD